MTNLEPLPTRMFFVLQEKERIEEVGVTLCYVVYYPEYQSTNKQHTWESLSDHKKSLFNVKVQWIREAWMSSSLLQVSKRHHFWSNFTRLSNYSINTHFQQQSHSGREKYSQPIEMEERSCSALDINMAQTRNMYIRFFFLQNKWTTWEEVSEFCPSGGGFCLSNNLTVHDLSSIHPWGCKSSSFRHE